MKLIDLVLVINGRSFDLTQVMAPTDRDGLDVIPAAGDEVCVAIRPAKTNEPWLLSGRTKLESTR